MIAVHRNLESVLARVSRTRNDQLGPVRFELGNVHVLHAANARNQAFQRDGGRRTLQCQQRKIPVKFDGAGFRERSVQQRGDFVPPRAVRHEAVAIIQPAGNEIVHDSAKFVGDDAVNLST